MIAKTTINKFEVEIGEPYPFWITIKHDGKEIARVHHEELKDLEYAVGRTRDILRSAMHASQKHEA